MKLMTLLFACCAIALGTSGQTKTGAGSRAYHSNEIKWTLQVPEGWEIIPAKKQAETDKKGKDAMEKANDVKIDASDMINLISFKKGQFNVFGATIEPMEQGKPGDYETNNREVYKLLYATFTDQGLKVDTSSGIEMIQGLKFYVFNTALSAPGSSEVLLRQSLYSRWYKGYDFGISISYNNEADKEAMLKAFRNSKFE